MSEPLRRSDPIKLIVGALLGFGGLVALHALRRRYHDTHCQAGELQRSRDDGSSTGIEAVASGPFVTETSAPGVIEDLDSDGAPGLPSVPRYKPGRRSTVSGPSTNLAETRRYRPTAFPKTAQEETNLKRWLRTCHLFTQLDDDEIGLVIAAMVRVTFVQGNFMTLQGDGVDSETDRFMVIAHGEVSVIKDGTVLRVLRQGQFFGERHLMFVNSVWRLTHRVDTPTCECFALAADDYRHIVTRVAVDKTTDAEPTSARNEVQPT
jgi:hypothetical protein